MSTPGTADGKNFSHLPMCLNVTMRSDNQNSVFNVEYQSKVGTVNIMNIELMSWNLCPINLIFTPIASISIISTNYKTLILYSTAC